MKNLKYSTYLAALLLLFVSCRKPTVVPTGNSAVRWVNSTHLEHLYVPAKLANGTEVGTIAIYADYPDYKLVTAVNEGFTCIDDVARAAIFYLHEPDLASDAGKQDKLLKMTEFVLQLQASNGYFYNFLNDDLSINTIYQTSVANANWWSWRALWHLSEVYPHYNTTNPALAERIQAAMTRVIDNIKRDFRTGEFTKTAHGLKIPTWLPSGSGTDQAAVMILGLTNVYSETKDASLPPVIEHLANGILAMQQGNAVEFPHGAFLSWENTWHAYGSDQAYALLKAGKLLDKQAWIDAAKKEVDNFYPYLLKNNFIDSFEIELVNGEIKVLKKEVFAQISYGIRPMIWAVLELYQQNKDPKYLSLAGQILAWYVGNNPAKIKMYDKQTGICFDGISSATAANKNSGAESTIEALWAFQLAEKFPEVLKELEKY